MKVIIKRAWGFDVKVYEKVLNELNAVYEDDNAIIEVEKVEDLFRLSRKLDHSLIIETFDEDQICIYDRFIE